MVRDWLGMAGCRGVGGRGSAHTVSNSTGESPCVYTGWGSTGRYVTGKVKVNRRSGGCLRALG